MGLGAGADDSVQPPALVTFNFRTPAPLSVEQGHSTPQKAHRARLLLDEKALGVWHAGEGIDGPMHILVSSIWRADLTQVSGNPLRNTLKSGRSAYVGHG